MTDNVWDYTAFITNGLTVTLKLLVGTMLFSFVLSTIISVLRYKRIGTIFWMGFVSFFRGMPSLLTVSFLYLFLPSFFGIKVSVVMTGVLAFGLQSAAYMSEIMRAGIQSISKGQFEAARALNIKEFYMWRGIIFPQILNKILPPLVGETVGVLKETAIIAVIGGMDIMRHVQIASAEHFTFFEPMLVGAACYYSIILCVEFIVRYFERRASRYAESY